MTRRAAREQSLEGVPESTGYVLFIPDCGGQGQESGHISDRLSDRRRGDHGTIQGERTAVGGSGNMFFTNGSILTL